MKRLMLGSLVPPHLNGILEKKIKENKGKEFVKEIMDENDGNPYIKQPQQMPNSKFFFKKNPHWSSRCGAVVNESD